MMKFVLSRSLTFNERLRAAKILYRVIGRESTLSGLARHFECHRTKLGPASGRRQNPPSPPGANDSPASAPFAKQISSLLYLTKRDHTQKVYYAEPDPLRGSLLLPMTAHTQLVGFIACGPKRDRTHYLPGEVETLSALAHRSGSAYLWLTARQPAIEAVPTL